jgi:hypothetical protein
MVANGIAKFPKAVEKVTSLTQMPLATRQQLVRLFQQWGSENSPKHQPEHPRTEIPLFVSSQEVLKTVSSTAP